MILILARKDDFTAKKLHGYFTDNAIPCIIANNLQNIRFSLSGDNSGQTEMDVSYHGTKITAILNRGLDTQADYFCHSETTAAWWSLMACFKGPVINRPSRLGFLPFINGQLLSKHIKGLHPADVVYSNNLAVNECTDPSITTNVHSVYHNTYAGKLDGAFRFDNNEAYRLTSFNAESTKNFLIAGNDIFSLSCPESLLSPGIISILQQISEALPRFYVNFGYIVLQDTYNKYSVTHISPFPSFNFYKHLAPQVHNSLLKFLTV